MKVNFVAGFPPIVKSLDSGRDFYEHRLGLSVRSEDSEDYSVVDIPGLTHFGLWTLSDAARSTFGG